MGLRIRIALLVGFAALAAACAKKEEEIVFVQPDAIIEEPAYSKY